MSLCFRLMTATSPINTAVGDDRGALDIFEFGLEYPCSPTSEGFQVTVHSYRATRVDVVADFFAAPLLISILGP